MTLDTAYTVETLHLGQIGIDVTITGEDALDEFEFTVPLGDSKQWFIGKKVKLSVSASNGR